MSYKSIKVSLILSISSLLNLSFSSGDSASKYELQARSPVGRVLSLEDDKRGEKVISGISGELPTDGTSSRRQNWAQRSVRDGLSKIRESRRNRRLELINSQLPPSSSSDDDSGTESEKSSRRNTLVEEKKEMPTRAASVRLHFPEDKEDKEKERFKKYAQAIVYEIEQGPAQSAEEKYRALLAKLGLGSVSEEDEWI